MVSQMLYYFIKDRNLLLEVTLIHILQVTLGKEYPLLDMYSQLQEL
jgi:hypothetical protein